MRKSLVSKAFDHATFSTLKKKNTNNQEHSLVHQTHKTMSNIYTQYNKNITFSARAQVTIFCTAKVVPLVQHIKMCTGSLKGGKATIATTLRGHQKYLNTPLK